MMVAFYNFSMAFRLIVLLFLFLNVVHAQDEGDSEPEGGDGAKGGNGGENGETPPCDVDVAFIMDSSGSVDTEEFGKEKDFVKKAAEKMAVEPSNSQAAVIRFADNATVEIKFQDTATWDEFKSAVDKITNTTGGGTRIDEALKKAKEVFKSVSGERLKLLVLLTDGKQTGQDVRLATLSSELRNESVRVFVVGVGKAVNRTQLELIAGDEKHVVTADNFDKLDLKITQLITKACACPVDVAFIMDASGSQKNAFINEKEIVIGLTKNMTIGATNAKSRAALMHFSVSAKVDGLFGTYATAAEFQTAVKGLPFLGKQTRIDRTLELASREVFKKSSSSRPQIAIILTNGIQHSESQEVPKGLIEASRPLRNKGVRVIAVGNAVYTSEKRLRLMTERNTDVVVDKNKNVVINKVKLLLKNACKPLPRKAPGISTDCNDKLRHNVCASQAAKPNYCKNYPDYMAENCPKSCNLCPPTY